MSRKVSFKKSTKMQKQENAVLEVAGVNKNQSNLLANFLAFASLLQHRVKNESLFNQT